MNPLRRINVYKNVAFSCLGTFVSSLPNDGIFCRIRRRYWNSRGFEFDKTCIIFRNVYFLGLVKIGKRSSISNNCFINGGPEGVCIGDDVMIAPGCALAAFNHGFTDLETPMVEQSWSSASIIIEDDVWVGANCTITAGVRVEKGSIIGANSVVTKNVPPYSIMGGVPATIIGTRLKPKSVRN